MTKTESLDPDDARALADAVARAEYHAAQLLRAYAWLLVLTTPGREPRPAPGLLSDRALESRAAEAAKEAAERRKSPRVGVGALATTAAPAAVVMLDAQAAVVRAVGRVTRRVGRHIPPTHRLPARRRARPSDVVDAIHWLAGGDPAWAVSPAGEVLRQGVLSELQSLRVAERVVEDLRDAADAARSAAAITPDRVVPYPGGPCPACGRRSLQIDATLSNPRWWWVECISEACVCTGPGCPCGRLPFSTDRGRHSWRGAQLQRLDAAIAARRRRSPVRSTVRGHGGWPDRHTPPEAARVLV